MRRRFISFILAVFILIPLIPNSVHSIGLVKEIDVLVNGFKLQVDGKSFSHKEVFLYEGDVFVPMKDLGNSLGLMVNLNISNRTLSLSSKGRLNFDDKSKYPISYQRGYEIDASMRLMDNINKEIGNFLKGTNSVSKSKNLDLKSIKVGFSNIKVLLDGKQIFLDREPLLYNDDIYLSLTSLSPYLYITPKLDNNTLDIDLNGVLKDKAKSTFFPSYYSIDELVKFREDLNNRYSRELAELNKKKKIIMDVKIPYEEVKSLDDMEKYLNKHLGKIKDLSVYIDLQAGTGNSYYIDIDFSTKDNSKWRNLTRRDVEAYIWDIYVAISSIYDENAKLQGNIMKYVSFDTKVKNIVFSFIDSGLDLKVKVDPIFIKELLEKEFGRYDGERFNYSARVSGYDLELVITPWDSDFLNKWSPNLKLGFLEMINREIGRYYPGLKINGKVIYDDLEPLLFIIEDNKVRSTTLMNGTNGLLNDKYGVLFANGVRIPMKYSLHRIDVDNFKLMVDMDYLISDPKWNRESNDALAALMNEVVILLMDMWDANIFVQVFDRSQALAYEYVISQDTVQMVKATPSGGQVIEGSKVELSSSTNGAKIYYTLDESMPTKNSISYVDPIVIGRDTTIRAFAIKDGFKDSAVSSFEYTVISDLDMATGLDKLTFTIGTLDDVFNKNNLNYILSVPYGTDTTKIIPVASVGSITVNDTLVDSGDGLDLAISNNSIITVVHSEVGKTKNKTYSITVKVGPQEESNVKLDSGYVFSNSLFALFSGQLTGNYVGHKVRLLSGTGIKYGEVGVDSNGEFEILGYPIGYPFNGIGYKYEILNSGDKVIDSGTLRVQ